MSEQQDTAEEALIEGRRSEHARVLEEGGYPHRFERTHLASELRDQYADLEPGAETTDTVTVAGRLMLSRSFGKLQFGTLQDVSGTIQLFVDRKVSETATDRFSRFDLGDWVGATGLVMTTRKGELSVKVEDLTLLQKALRPIPDKFHGLADVETRSRRRYLDLMVNEEARHVAVTRSKVVSALREQFERRGFIEVETPVLLQQATGATARPFETYHNTLDMEMYLRIATELFLKRLVVGGLERVYEIGRIFRNEGVDATHNPEFTMLEAYQAFADYTDIMTLIEDVFVAVVETAVETRRPEYLGRDLSFEPPFRRVTMVELVSDYVGQEVTLDTNVAVLTALVQEHRGDVSDDAGPGRLLFELYEQAHRHVWEPTFVTDFPTEVSPLARRRSDDGRLTERFELVIAGAEYCNAFSELNDADDQRARFEEQMARRDAGDASAHPIDEDYLIALEYGLPPTGGLGIGVDRLVMLLTDQPHIREVILFPTLRPLPD